MNSDTLFKRLVYLGPRDVRKNRADAVHMMMSCGGFSANGVDITLVTPRVRRKDWYVTLDGLWTLYSMKPAFSIHELPMYVVEGSWSERTLRLQQFVLVFFYFFAMRWRNSSAHPSTLVYAKCYTSCLAAIVSRLFTRAKWKICFEKPDFDERKYLHKLVCRNVDGIVATTPAVIRGLTDNYQIPKNRVFYRPYYTWINVFEPSDESSVGLRTRWNLSIEHPLVFFGGKVDRGSGEVKHIIKAAAGLPQYRFLIAGATPEAKEFFELFAEEVGAMNIQIEGFKPVNEFFEYACAADLLISYYDADHFSSYHRSAAKMMLYACAHRPVIMADLPNSRRLFQDAGVLLVEPGDTERLRDAIHHILSHPVEARERADQTYGYAQENDAISSTGKILRFAETVNR